MVQPVASASIDVTANITRLQKQLDKADRRLRKMERGSKRTSKVMAAGFKRTTLAVGAFAASMGVAVKAISDAGIKAQGLDRAFRAATGSAKAGAQEFAFVRSEANRLGLDLVTSAEAFAKFAASAQGTSLEGQNVRDVFTAVAEASRVMSLSTEQTQGALTALEQIVSKGKVSAEELRGQLGERLPGAFLIAARSIGKTTAELDEMLRLGQLTAEDLLPKFAEELRKTFGAEVESAANDAQAAYTRFGNAMFELKVAVANSGILDALAGLANLSTSAVKELTEFARILGFVPDTEAGFNAAALEFWNKALADSTAKLRALKDEAVESNTFFGGIFGRSPEEVKAALDAEVARFKNIQEQIEKLKGAGGGEEELAEQLRKEAEREREAAARARVEAVRKGLVESERITLESVRRTAEQELAIKQEMEALALEGKRLSDQELIALAEETARAKVTAEFAAEQAAKGELGKAMTAEEEIEQLRALNDEKIAEYKRLQGEQESILQNTAKAQLQADRLMVDSKSRAISSLLGLMSLFAGKSKAIALAMIAIETSRGLAENQIAVAVAAAKALAVLGPIAGPPAAAKIKAWGAVNAGVIASAGVARGVAAISGGGAASGLGAAESTISSFEDVQEREERRDESRVQIIIQGDVNGFDDFAQSKIIPAIQAAVKDQDVVLIDAESRNAAEIVDAAERNV